MGSTIVILFEGTVDNEYFQLEFERYIDFLKGEYGADTNGDGEISSAWNATKSTDPLTIEGLDSSLLTVHSVNIGNNNQTRYYATLDETSLSSHDGHDTILDFGKGADKLVLNGVSMADYYQYFDVVNDGGSTTLMLKDNSWSVTLNNVNMDMAALAGHIDFAA